MLRRAFVSLLATASLFALTGEQAYADEILLRIDATGDGGNILTLTDADLMALPQVEFTTTTIWTQGSIRFSGPSLASVLESVGVASGAINMFAINDYKVEIPLDHIEPNAPIIANRMNGSPFRIRDNGPLWVVFPYDSDDRYQSETIYAFSIWQLTQIRVAPD